ncbi:MAG TPA: hypothetical protein VMM59_08935 [Thermohalobaculum sp.]|nr:hypothetical protein [Thermohalobaculum sp.]
MPESGTTSGTTSGTAAERPDGGRGCSRWLRTWALGAALLVPGTAWAAAFKQAPGADKESGGTGGPDTILGLVDINTAFFIAVGVVAFFWFLFGGGRRAKLRGKDH